MAVAMIGPKFYAWDRNGKPLAFGKLYTYQARTNTPKPTYQSEDQVVENTNPVILNGEGYANVYLDGSYKMVLKDDKDNEIWSSDPVSSAQPDEWVNCLTATYLGPSSFKVSGNFSDTYDVGRRVRINNGLTEFAYSTIESSTFAGGETTVVITDSVVTTGVIGVCASIVGTESLSTTSVLNFPDLDSAINSNQVKKGYAVNIKEREEGFGGGGLWDVVDSSLVSPNGVNIVASAVNNNLSFVLRTGIVIDLNQLGFKASESHDETIFNVVMELLPIGGTVTCKNAEYTITPTAQIKQNPFVVFDWNNSVIKSEFVGGSVFYLDCRSSSSFQIGAGHKNLRLGSNNSFNDATREYDHFYKIDGGWAQGIVWENIVADPNLAIKSGLHFDLTGAGEVGVPDTSTIKDINFLKAYGSSAAISAEGTSGESARIGQINVKDFLFGAIYSLDFDGVASTGDCGAIYLKYCGWGAGEFSNLYGNPSVIKGNEESKIDGANLSSLYQEIDNFLNASLIANGTALVNGVTLQNCIIDRPEAYIDTLVIATKPGDRRMIDAVMIDTDIVKPRVTDPRGDWNLINQSTINARSGSRGGSVEPIKFLEGIDKTDDWHTKISVPKSTEVGNSYPKFRTRIRDLRINSDTDTLVFTIPGDFIEMADTIRVRLDSQAGGGSYSVRVGGFNSGGEIVTQAVNSSSGDSYVELDINILGNDSKRDLTSAPCKSYKKVVQSAAVLQDSLDGQAYLAGSDLTFTIRTTGSTTDVRVNAAVVGHIKSDFVIYT